MAYTRERGDRHLACWRGPDGRTRTKGGFKRKRDALEYAQRQEHSIVDGVYVDPRAGRLTLDAWWAEWWPTCVHLAPTTRDRDARTYKNHVAPTFGKAPVAKITNASVRHWIVKLDDGTRSSSTVHKAHHVLRKTLQAAVQAGKLRANPADDVDLPTIVRAEMRVLDRDELGALAGAIDARYRRFVILGAWAGLREAEIAGLTWARVGTGHVDVAQQVVDVGGSVRVTSRLKTSAARRRVPIPAFAWSQLDQDRGEPDEWVVPAAGGGPLRINNFRRRVWAPAVTKAGLEGLVPHELRHTAVSWWIAHGATPVDCARWAGHASVKTILDTYGHLFPAHTAEVIGRLDAFGRGQTSTEGTIRPSGSDSGNVASE